MQGRILSLQTQKCYRSPNLRDVCFILFRSRIEIEFKATSTSGVLFAALDYEDQDVVSALLHSGYIIFARQCGYGNIVEIFRQKLDRFRWHKVRTGFYRFHLVE